MVAQVEPRQEAPPDVPEAAAALAFVGRADALGKVTDALSRGPSLVLIEGEPGIGKTRLLHEVLKSEHVANRRVMVAACPPLREPFPLGPVVDGLRRLRPRLAEVELSPLGGALRPLFPEWAEVLPPALESLDSPKETRHRLFSALTELVERLGVEVIVVEDAHWADSATLEWLLTLSSGGDLRTSYVVTYRPTDVPVGSPLLRLTSQLPPGMAQRRVELEPLDAGQTRELVASMLATDEVSEKFSVFLCERADGIPLAIEESVRLLRDRGDIVRHEGQWTRRSLDEIEVPPTVRDSVLERVARLPSEARRVLEAAAVLAEPAGEALLAAAAGIDTARGERGLAAALASGVLREASPGQFVFRHVLDSQAVVEAIPASRRRSIHGRAAQALRAIKPEPVLRLARHCREAGDTEPWCRYAEVGAGLALETGDDWNTVATLLDVLESVEHPIERRVRLVRKLGEALHVGAAPTAELAGRVAESLSAVLASGEISQEERGELRLLRGRTLWRAGQERSAFEEIEAAVPDLGHRPDLAIRAMLNLARPASSPDWPAEVHLQWLQRAADLANTNGSPADRRLLTQTRTDVLLQFAVQEAWDSLDSISEPPRLASQTERRVFGGHTLNIAIATLPWGRYGLSRQLLNDAVAFLEAIDHKRFLNGAQVFVAYLDWYTGSWDGLAKTALALAESDDLDPPHLKRLTGQLYSVLLTVTGSRSAGEAGLRREMTEVGRPLVVEPESLLAPSMLSRLLMDDGAVDEALDVTLPVVEMIARKGVWLWATDIGPVYVDILTRSGRMGEAERFVDDFVAGLEGRDAPAPAASLMVCQAILAESTEVPGEATALFADAASAWAALPRPYDELLARERQGRCLLVAGQRLDGLEVLTDAERRLRELGARWDADRLAQVLREYGVEVSRAWKRGRRGYGGRLSPREKEVLVLVARGMTNRQVGEVLFLSSKTVGGHLSSGMRKLGVSSRTAAALAATEAGLISAEG